ncbi:MAG: hypothetical protein Tsb0027_03100 [Wenzhouxiangellaceae bacterium]
MGVLTYDGDSEMSSPERDLLGKVQAWASIVSSIAIPVAIALMGWVVQNKIANEGTRKDYVSMALDILTTPETVEQEQLRAWAVAIVDKNSPVPLSGELRTQLEKGEVTIRSFIFPDPPESFLDPPQSWADLPAEGPVTNGDLLNSYIENRYRFDYNKIYIESLQKWIASMNRIFNEEDFTKELEKGDEAQE